MENPFSHNRATNVIGRVLDEVAKEEETERHCDHSDPALCKISFASLEHRIMMKLWEHDCLTDHALETVGMAGRNGEAELRLDQSA
jgi:hypothetical protein